MKRTTKEILSVLLLSLLLEVPVIAADVNPRLYNLAQGFLEKEQFRDALDMLLPLLEEAPDSPNLNFKVGICYYNIVNEKYKALRYFEKALKGMSHDYSFNSPDLEKSPYDVLYFLADISLHNNQPDRALFYLVQYYNVYKGDTPLKIETLLNWSANAQDYFDSPLNISIQSAGYLINTEGIETSPVITLDNSVLFIGTNRGLVGMAAHSRELDIYYSVRGFSGEWGELIKFPHNTSDDEYPVCVSADGKTLYLARKGKAHYDLFSSELTGDNWTVPKKLKGKVNSRYNETSASITLDNQYLYFSSDHRKGKGGFDIYYSKADKNGRWGRSKNLGREVNSSDNEIAPYIHPYGSELYFSSDGYFLRSMGGYDVYKVTRGENDKWKGLLNVGYPVNSTRDDLFFSVKSGGVRYIAALSDFNDYDILEITGDGFISDEIDISAELVELRNELSVLEIIEMEKIVEKEIEVTELFEMETESFIDNAEETDVDSSIVEDEIFIDSIMGSDSLSASEFLTEELTEPIDESTDVDTIVEEPSESEVFDLAVLNEEQLDSLKKQQILDNAREYLNGMIDANNAAIFKTIYFDFNSSELLMLSKEELQFLIDFMHDEKDLKVEVVGHTDILGNWDVNLDISRKRAYAVYRFLLENNITRDRIIYYGKGSAIPVAENHSDAGRALNRRVEIMLLKQN